MRSSSSSLALATLELFVNLQDKRQLVEYVKTRLTIPDVLVEALDQAILAKFLKDPDRFDSRFYDDAWLADLRSCVLKVPSRIVPEEANYLLNPVHPAFALAHETTTYQVDARLWREQG